MRGLAYGIALIYLSAVLAGEYTVPTLKRRSENASLGLDLPVDRAM
ncbi:hypothetical protein [Aminivibrio sp.]